MSNKLVAIVDDDASVRRTLEYAFQSRGFSTVPYINGEDLLAGDLNVHAVVMDTDMPGRLGYEICAVVKERRPDLPVVGTSGRPDYAQSWTQAGAVAFFAKPFSIFEVVDKVKPYLD